MTESLGNLKEKKIMADELKNDDGSDTQDATDRTDPGMADNPDAIIVTNVNETVFDIDKIREDFEALFQDFDDRASFQYFKRFRRVRVNYSCPALADRARIHLNETEICGRLAKCYFVQSSSSDFDPSSPFLQPPPVPRQFLISPPASPPMGWEQSREAKPVINYDLISAIAQLAPGETQELHPPSEHQPGIVVHICDKPVGFPHKAKTEIVQTQRPENKS